MSRQITQPVNQVRLTNVAVVRMNRHGKRFEIACYRNKIVNYRQGTETDISEVLQTDRVFTNVSKGQFSPKSDLQKAFQTEDEEEICKLILLKGQVQISDLEREAQYENMAREIATMVSTKCVNPTSNRPYTQLQIRNAMKDAEFAVHPTKGVKQQFLDCVKLLKKTGVIEIERAKMELGLFLVYDGEEGEHLLHEKRQECVQQLRQVGVTRFVVNDDDKEQNNNTLKTGNLQQQQQEESIIFQIDPSLYRAVDSVVKDLISNNHDKALSVRLEIIKQVVTMEGDVHMENEIERKENQKEKEEEEEEMAQQQDKQELNEEDEEEEEDDDIDAIVTKSKDIAIVSDDEGTSDGNADKTIDAPILHSDDDDDDDVDDDMDNFTSAKAKKRKQKKNKRRAAAAAAAAAAATAAVDSPPTSPSLPPTSARKNNKKAAKKSKKAKRREKEEALERKERLEAEQKRLEERRKLHGDDDDAAAPLTTNNDETSTTTTMTTTAASKTCNTCGGLFESQAQYRLHFRSDWHRYNVKLKMKGMAPVSEQEFLLCDSDAFFESF